MEPAKRPCSMHLERVTAGYIAQRHPLLTVSRSSADVTQLQRNGVSSSGEEKQRHHLLSSMVSSLKARLKVSPDLNSEGSQSCVGKHAAKLDPQAAGVPSFSFMNRSVAERGESLKRLKLS